MSPAAPISGHRVQTFWKQKCAQPVCTIFLARTTVCCCVFLYKLLVQTKQQTVDRNVFAWPPCDGQAIASWTLSFCLYFYLPHFELYSLLLLNLPYFSPSFAFSPRSGAGDALGQDCRASVDHQTNQRTAGGSHPTRLLKF